MRLSEAIHLQWEHLNGMNGRVMVREGKGCKDRTLWVDDSTMQDLLDWRERQTTRIGKQDYIFTTFKGTPIQDSYVQQMLRRYAKKAGIKHVYPHMLRHTFATEYLEAGGNIRHLQMLLGHANLATTEIYLHVVDSDLETHLKDIQSRW